MSALLRLLRRSIPPISAGTTAGRPRWRPPTNCSVRPTSAGWPGSTSGPARCSPARAPGGPPCRPAPPSPSGTGSSSDRRVVAGALPRRTAIVRRAAGLDAKAQTLAANVDTVLVLVAADGRVSPRSVERYVTLVWESGAVPVVVLTKADLVSADDLDDAVERLEPACVGVALHAISAETGTGLDDLAPYFGPGRTVALLGSSGAGKSTLANRLTGAGAGHRRRPGGRQPGPAHHHPPRARARPRRRGAHRHARAAGGRPLAGCDRRLTPPLSGGHPRSPG